MKNSSKNISIKPGQIYDWYSCGEFVDKMTIKKVTKTTVFFRWHNLDNEDIFNGEWRREEFYFDKESFPDDYVVLDTITAFNELLDKYYGT